MGILFNRNYTTNRKKIFKDLSKQKKIINHTCKKSLKTNSKYSKTQLPIHSRQIDYLINSLDDKQIHVNREFTKIFKLPVKVRKKNNFKYHITKPKFKTEKIVRRKQKVKIDKIEEVSKHKLKIKHELNQFNKFDPILNYKQEKDMNKIIDKSDLEIVRHRSINETDLSVYAIKKTNPILKHKIKQSTRRIISKIKFKYQLLTNEINKKETNKKSVSIQEPDKKVEKEEKVNEDIGKYAIKLDRTLLTAIQLHHDFSKALEIAKQLDQPFRKAHDITISLDVIKISKNDSNYMLI